VELPVWVGTYYSTYVLSSRERELELELELEFSVVRMDG
jgi:hypothetical protein